MFTEYVVPHAGEERESSAGFVERVCLPFLAATQNPDGGWGYHPGSESSVEATAWALMALAADGAQRSLDNAAAVLTLPNQRPQSQSTDPVLQTAGLGETACRGFDWLSQVQLPDGSWPAFKGMREGCWATALGCMALREHAQSADRVARGIEWLVGARPAEVTLWRRLQRRLSRGPSATRQNHSFYGWSWTPGTASWVEPTSYAHILLGSVPVALQPPGTASRILLAEGMLYDRMCRGGGWNAGNPEVYSVTGLPRAGPTVWALVALRRRQTRSENLESVRWLEDQKIRGPASLALARLCLATYGRRMPPIEPALWELHRENQFFRSVPVFAWVVLALSGKLPWAWKR